jgi:hypothetical protein
MKSPLEQEGLKFYNGKLPLVMADWNRMFFVVMLYRLGEYDWFLFCGALSPGY